MSQIPYLNHLCSYSTDDPNATLNLSCNLFLVASPLPANEASMIAYINGAIIHSWYHSQPIEVVSTIVGLLTLIIPNTLTGTNQLTENNMPQLMFRLINGSLPIQLISDVNRAGAGSLLYYLWVYCPICFQVGANSLNLLTQSNLFLHILYFFISPDLITTTIAPMEPINPATILRLLHVFTKNHPLTTLPDFYLKDERLILISNIDIYCKNHMRLP